MSSLSRATAVMSFGTVLSRVTGLARLAAIAAALGVAETRLTDTYNLANTAPNILYELVLGGVLTSVFVPVFVELLEKEGREKAWQVGSAILNLSIVILTAVTVLGILLAPWIAKFYALRLDGPDEVQQREALTFLLRLFFPQIIFYALTAITAGFLNAHKRFGAPMYTPILNNLAVITVFIAFAQAYGTVSLAEVETSHLLLIGLGTTAGVALMAFAQLPFLRGLGKYRFTLSIAHPSVKKLGRLSVFVVGYVVTNQIGYLVVQWLANKQTGGYSAYVAAFTFFMLPHGLFAVSVITALLPSMSEHAINERWEEYRDRLSVGIRATVLLVLPAAVGYFVLGEPIVRLLLERGVMTDRSTELVADVLRFFVLGLVPFSIFQLLLRAFYALHDTKTPFLINCAAIALNTAVNVPMFQLLGVEGLAAGHAISYVFGVTAQGVSLNRRVGGIWGREVTASVTRIGAAALGMGVVVWVAWRALAPLVGAGLFGQTLEVAVPAGVGAVAFLLLAHVLRVPELDMVRGLIARRAPKPPVPEEDDFERR
ncbi:MAG: murein biosynthesis integral membrane protein MurJ [Actinomycetota bacterium]